MTIYHLLSRSCPEVIQRRRDDIVGEDTVVVSERSASFCCIRYGAVDQQIVVQDATW